MKLNSICPNKQNLFCTACFLAGDFNFSFHEVSVSVVLREES